MNPQDQQPHQPQSQQPSPRPSNGDSTQRDATANMIRDQISRLFGDPTGGDSQPAANNNQPEPKPQPRQQIQSQPRQVGSLSSSRSRTIERASSAVQANTPPQQAQQPAPVAATPTQPTIQSAAEQKPVAAAKTNTQPSSTNIDSGLYARTQQNTGTVSEEQWRKYHSSWQQYYQQYYERYYTQTLANEKAKQQSVAPTSNPQPAVTQISFGSSSEAEGGQTLTKRQAVKELRSQIRDKVSDSAVKVRKSRHFVPLLAAFGVLILFLFLQYNRVLFASVEAYIAPGTVTPGDIIVDPSSTEALDNDPKLIIPKLNINVPAVYDGTMGSTNQQTHDRQMKAMEKGVAWFGVPGADSKPGQNGNVVLSGHSSNDVIDPGEYKFIFARLDKLKEGDTIYLNYKGTRYTYSVTGTKVVKPTNLKALQTGNDKPTLTLITCTPLGTSLNRLLVYADQISPDPSNATKAKDYDSSADSAEMPGNSPTLLKRIFGGDN